MSSFTHKDNGFESLRIDETETTLVFRKISSKQSSTASDLALIRSQILHELSAFTDIYLVTTAKEPENAGEL